MRLVREWGLTVGLAVILGLVVSCVSLSYAAGLGEITGVLQDANQEARGSIVPAVAAILGVIVLIGVGAGLVRVISRST